MYLRERFENSGPADKKGAVLRNEPSRETAQPGSAVGIGRAARDGGGPVMARGGRPPVMLPPRRMRPSVLDFPADKALDNLRARRLNVSGSSGSRSTFTAVTGATVADSAAALRSSNSFHVNNNNKAAATGSAGHHYHSSGELWTDANGSSNNSRQPASPARPRRRRPVSASAVCGGAKERNLGQMAAAFEAMHPDGRESTRGEGDGATGAMLHRGPQTRDPQQNQRTRRGGGSTGTVRTRRPRSARATLQRPPPVATDYYHYPSEKGYFNQRPPQQEQQQEQHSRPLSVEPRPRAADETRPMHGSGNNSRGEAARSGRGGGEGAGRGAQRFSQEDLLPTGSRSVSTRQEPDEDEMAWLRSR